jgi:hypothetical protein
MHGESRLNRLTEEVELFERVDEKLIDRARAILGMGVSERDAAKTLQKSGVSRQDAFLAIKAAKLMMKEAVAKRVRKRKAGKGSRKMTKVCPRGMHMKGGRCARVPLGKLRKTARVKARKRRTGKGKMAIKRQKRYAKRWNR